MHYIAAVVPCVSRFKKVLTETSSKVTIRSLETLPIPRTVVIPVENQASAIISDN